MKRVVLVGGLILAACNPPADDSQGRFETIAIAVMENPDCVFRPIDNEDQLVFATYKDNSDFMAVARYKGETIKLVPRDAPTFDGNSFDITYEVIDYLNWQVRAVSDRGVGELRLIRDGEPTNIMSPMQGSCGA